MNRSQFLFAFLWVSTISAATAEEGGYSTQINITGKEQGAYSIGATVRPTEQSVPMTGAGSSASRPKRPYKMDPSRNITNEDLGRIIESLGPFPDPFANQMNAKDFKRALDDIDKDIDAGKYSKQPQSTQSADPHKSVDPHPHTTAVISDPPQGVTELDPDVIERPSYENDLNSNQLELNLTRARRDLIQAQDDLARSGNERARQDAIGRIDDAKRRIQEATNAMP